MFLIRTETYTLKLIAKTEPVTYVIHILEWTVHFSSMLFITTLVCFLTLASCLPDGTPRLPVRPESQRRFGIVGGKETHIKNYPYTVSLYVDDDAQLYGSGAIINNYWVVSAASQLFLVEKKTVTVRAGSDDVSGGGQVLNSSQIILHENYTGDYDYDIALIKVSRKIKFNKFTKPVKLASDYPKPLSKAVITGWGIQESLQPGMYYPPIQAATVKVWSKEECKLAHIYLDVNRCLCADADGVGLCSDDTGAPLVHNTQLIGLFLGGDICNAYKVVEIYSSVAAHKQWIEDTIKKNSLSHEMEGMDWPV